MSGEGVIVNPPVDTEPLADAAAAQAAADAAIAETNAAAAVEATRIAQEEETERARIAAEAAAAIASAVTKEELDECRRNIETTLAETRELRSLMQSISERLVKLEPPPLPLEEERSAATLDNQEAPPADKPKAPARRRNWT